MHAQTNDACTVCTVMHAQALQMHTSGTTALLQSKDSCTRTSVLWYTHVYGPCICMHIHTSVYSAPVRGISIGARCAL